MTAIVSGPLVIAKKADGSDLYLYEDAILPDSVPADEVKRLVGLGLVRELGKGEALPPPPASESN
jgi:hypothetical protein